MTYPEADVTYPEADATYPEADATYPEADAAYPEADAAYPEADVAYPEGGWATANDESPNAVVGDFGVATAGGGWKVGGGVGPALLGGVSRLHPDHCQIMVSKLLHTRYRVEDLEKTIAFYTQVLGLAEVRRHKSPRGSELVFLKAPESTELLEICRYEGSGPVVVGPDLTHLAFEVADLEAFAAHAAALGYPLSDGPTTSGSGTRFAFIDAPEGYEIELIERGSVIPGT